MRTLIAIPIYNEERYVCRVIDRVLEHGHDVLVIDDGSTDRSPELLAGKPVRVIRHETNQGYGRSLRNAFDAAIEGGYDWVITMDCDEQHEPDWIPRFIEEARRGQYDVISGSRYMNLDDAEGTPPEDRRSINLRITTEINDRLGLSLTDSFCGFKAYRVEAVAGLEVAEDGYAFPMKFWVEAAAMGLRIGEIPVRLIYTDAARSFGGGLDDPTVREAHYRRVFHCAIRRRSDLFPAEVWADLRYVPCP